MRVVAHEGGHDHTARRTGPELADPGRRGRTRGTADRRLDAPTRRGRPDRRIRVGAAPVTDGPATDVGTATGRLATTAGRASDVADPIADPAARGASAPAIGSDPVREPSP